MKKIKKLNLSAEKIRNLSSDEAKKAAGGVSMTCNETYGACVPSQNIYCTGTCTYFGACTYPTQGLC